MAYEILAPMIEKIGVLKKAAGNACQSLSALRAFLNEKRHAAESIFVAARISGLVGDLSSDMMNSPLRESLPILRQLTEQGVRNEKITLAIAVSLMSSKMTSVHSRLLLGFLNDLVQQRMRLTNDVALPIAQELVQRGDLTQQQSSAVFLALRRLYLSDEHIRPLFERTYDGGDGPMSAKAAGNFAYGSFLGSGAMDLPIQALKSLSRVPAEELVIERLEPSTVRKLMIARVAALKLLGDRAYQELVPSSVRCALLKLSMESNLTYADLCTNDHPYLQDEHLKFVTAVRERLTQLRIPKWSRVMLPNINPTIGGVLPADILERGRARVWQCRTRFHYYVPLADRDTNVTPIPLVDDKLNETLLKSLGFKVITVPYWQWSVVSKLSSKIVRNYLRTSRCMSVTSQELPVSSLEGQFKAQSSQKDLPIHGSAGMNHTRDAHSIETFDAKRAALQHLSYTSRISKLTRADTAHGMSNRYLGEQFVRQDKLLQNDAWFHTRPISRSHVEESAGGFSVRQGESAFGASRKSAIDASRVSSPS